MQRPALFSLAVAAALCAGSIDARAAEGACPSQNDPDNSLDRVPDCMRMGRHVRVDTSVSRGTATLGDGMMPTTLRGGSSDFGPHRRLHVPVSPGGSLWSGFFAR